jgi:hypothetical protein
MRQADVWMAQLLEMSASGSTARLGWCPRIWSCQLFPEPAWPKARPLLFCPETARYYHCLFTAT